MSIVRSAAIGLGVTSIAIIYFLLYQDQHIGADQNPKQVEKVIKLIPNHKADDNKPLKHDKEHSSENQNSIQISKRFNKQSFNRKVNEIFGAEKAQVILDKELLSQTLSDLNSNGIEGVNFILNELQNTNFEPSTDTSPRIAKIDYLKYRMKFDSETIDMVLDLVKTELKDTNNNRQKAALFAERAELIGAIAKYRWDEVAQMIHNVNDPILKDISLYESYYALSEVYGPQQAMQKITMIKPNFKI